MFQFQKRNARRLTISKGSEFRTLNFLDRRQISVRKINGLNSETK
jgi:hypothetical protein